MFKRIVCLVVFCAMVIIPVIPAQESKKAAEKSKASAKHEKDMWRAWAITEGDKTQLTVEGIYQNGGLGLVASLEPAVPQGSNPNILLMNLTIAKLPGVWPLPVIPIPASYTKKPYSNNYESVQIIYPDGDLVGIDAITDAKKGPDSQGKKATR